MSDGPSDDRALRDFARKLGDVPMPVPPPIEHIERRVRRRQATRRGVASAGVLTMGLLALVVWSGREPAAQQVGFADGPDRSAAIEQPVLPDPAAPVGEWIWHDSDAMQSRDGSPTGYGSRAGVVADSLIVYFENGHLCVDAQTCENSPASYTAASFRSDFLEDGRYQSGLFGAESESNPFDGWSAVFVPHSTGDLYAGVNPVAEVPGVPGTHAMVGARNVEAMLDDLSISGATPRNIIVTGTGAGGMGALLNYERVVTAFPEASVNLLVDSAIVPLTKDLMPDCVLSALASGWDRSYPDDWDRVIETPYEQKLAGVYEYLSRKYPDAVFGLLSSTGDVEVRSVLGRGANECSANTPIAEAAYEAGVRDLAEHLSQFENWHVFVVTGTEHGFLTGGNPDLDTAAELRGIRDWLDLYRVENS